MRHVLALTYILVMIAMGFLIVALFAGGLEAVVFVPLITISVIVALTGYSVGVRYNRRLNAKERRDKDSPS